MRLIFLSSGDAACSESFDFVTEMSVYMITSFLCRIPASTDAYLANSILLFFECNELCLLGRANKYSFVIELATAVLSLVW